MCVCWCCVLGEVCKLCTGEVWWECCVYVRERGGCVRENTGAVCRRFWCGCYVCEVCRRCTRTLSLDKVVWMSCVGVICAGELCVWREILFSVFREGDFYVFCLCGEDLCMHM